ncbi:MULTISPECIES: DUF1934 domain-containing protein [Enterococcus]|uniref:DUF1934 domain-containing protein n=1 Tax=Enterococcus alcedinis TaxID=1274384 RepID=A0A917N3S1_9ENTE|nr:DUF1934 domain-containing protein [Enterococcus alcedinis]MBP2101331.1 uncharacterized beta-barrel protein YwiB (DUF1934 family) [Enterococcus alcedinis]GGI64369.1 hypothetical protein GCM10011482_00230 [Enterococcus alcedinis]
MKLKKGMPVNIFLKTMIEQKEGKEEFLYEITGQVARVGHNLYIRYEEPQADGVSFSPVTIKIYPDQSVQLIRTTAEARVRLHFQYEETTETIYKTPYGSMFFHVYTKELHTSLTDHPLAGKVRVNYDLLMQDEKIGSYEVYLEFTA